MLITLSHHIGTDVAPLGAVVTDLIFKKILSIRKLEKGRFLPFTNGKEAFRKYSPQKKNPVHAKSE